MKTLFLHFADQVEADAVLEPFLEQGLCVDVVGLIYAESDAGVGTVPVPLPGWHVNVLAADLPEPLQAYEVFPESPARVFAVDPVPVTVPQEVTMVQCRLALYDLHGIESDREFFYLVDVLPENERARARLELRTRLTVQRNNVLTMALCEAMGWDLDAMFIYAARQ